MTTLVESVNEPIEVLTWFRNGRMEPLRFRWRRRVVRVSRVTGDWTQKIGSERVHYFSVLGESTDSFELSFHSGTMAWRLTRVWLDG